jgi:hypothetical protein
MIYEKRDVDKENLSIGSFILVTWLTSSTLVTWYCIRKQRSKVIPYSKTKPSSRSTGLLIPIVLTNMPDWGLHDTLTNPYIHNISSYIIFLTPFPTNSFDFIFSARSCQNTCTISSICVLAVWCALYLCVIFVPYGLYSRSCNSWLCCPSFLLHNVFFSPCSSTSIPFLSCAQKYIIQKYNTLVQDNVVYTSTLLHLTYIII